MPTPPIATQTMKISEVKSHLSSLVNEIYRTRTRLRRRRLPLVVTPLATRAP